MINPIVMKQQEFEDLIGQLIDGSKKLTEQESRGFLNQETIYRLKEVRRAEN